MTASTKMDWMLKQWILVMEGLSVWQKVASVHLTHSNKLVMIRKKWYLVRKTTDHCFYMPQNERTQLKEGELFLSWEFKNWRWDLYLQRTFCCWCEKENILIQGWGSSSIEAPQILHACKGIAKCIWNLRKNWCERWNNQIWDSYYPQKSFTLQEQCNFTGHVHMLCRTHNIIWREWGISSSTVRVLVEEVPISRGEWIQDVLAANPTIPKERLRIPDIVGIAERYNILTTKEYGRVWLRHG